MTGGRHAESWKRQREGQRKREAQAEGETEGERVLSHYLCLVLAALFIVCGCASVRDRAVAAMNGTATFADGAHDHLAVSYEAALEQCLERSDTKPKALACADDVDHRFDSAWSAYRTARASWVALAAIINASDLSGVPPAEPEVLAMLAELAGAVAEFRAALLKVVP